MTPVTSRFTEHPRKMQAFSWYINRLGRMSAAEMAWRMGGMLRTASGMRKVRSAPQPHLGVLAAPRSFVHVPRGLDAAPYEQAALRILDGRYDIFDLHDCLLGFQVNWNRDPLTGIVAPLVPAALLDYRDEQQVGNIKYLWEPNRHLHLVSLAQAYALTGRTLYADAVKAHVLQWIEQCPPGRGANWSSSLELAIRLINWNIAWQLLGGKDAPCFASAQGEVFRSRWLTSVYQHAGAIVANLSRFSSANNHLIGEVTAVWTASITWPFWPDLERWGSRCRGIVIEEGLRQNAPDGGNREQAIAYQQFVLDFLLLAGLAGRANGEDFPDAFWTRIEAMIDFIAALMDFGHHVPMIGDADDGYVTRLAPQMVCPYRSLLVTGARLFGREDLACKAHLPDDEKTRWLLGDKPEESLAVMKKAHHLRTPKQTNIRAFPQSGYYLMGSNFGGPEEVRLIVDAGPLGYLTLAAHGHADALAILLSVGGSEVLIDPGTYAYHTEPEWRRYFRSTAAHNTVQVDGQDQSRQEGNFMWSRHARAGCEDFSISAGIQHFRGWHDGYTRLPDPVRHERHIDYIESERRFIVVDVLEGRASHCARRHWHFAPRLKPTITEGSIDVRVGAFRVQLSTRDPVSTAVHRGGSPAEGGWYSQRFGSKEPCSTVVWESRFTGRLELTTLITVSPV